MRGALAPSASHRRNPARPARAPVLITDRVDILAGGEQRAEERHLRLRGRAGVYRAGRRLEISRLGRTRRRSLSRGQPEKAKQPGVLSPQPPQLRSHRRRQLAIHALENLTHADHATWASRDKMRLLAVSVFASGHSAKSMRSN